MAESSERELGSAMAIEVATKDTTALSDAELAEMADLCAARPAAFDVGLMSKQVEEWVLVTQARDDGRLVGFSFATLERIGGTPSLLVGLASFAPGEAAEALAAVLTDQYRRALLAFPDEDVLVGTRLLEPAAFGAFAGLTDVVPRPGHKATGEERAWGRRLAKRFGAEGRIDDRRSILAGTGSPSPALDLSGPPDADSSLAALFSGLEVASGDALVAFGWAMAEDLAEGKLPG
ncbi:MAG: hypothetical protein ACRDYD_01680 [Acidimicrobiales bacterium]